MAKKIKTHVKKGDDVVVLSGAHKGATGRILQVLPEKGHVIVEGVRIIKRHTKPNNIHTEGGIIEQEGPIHISNVKLAK